MEEWQVESIALGRACREWTESWLADDDLLSGRVPSVDVQRLGGLGPLATLLLERRETKSFDPIGLEGASSGALFLSEFGRIPWVAAAIARAVVDGLPAQQAKARSLQDALRNFPNSAGLLLPLSARIDGLKTVWGLPLFFTRGLGPREMVLTDFSEQADVFAFGLPACLSRENSGDVTVTLVAQVSADRSRTHSDLCRLRLETRLREELSALRLKLPL